MKLPNYVIVLLITLYFAFLCRLLNTSTFSNNNRYNKVNKYNYYNDKDDNEEDIDEPYSPTIISTRYNNKDVRKQPVVSKPVLIKPIYKPVNITKKK